MPQVATSRTVGLALGGGAAQALAQIPILEALDELGLRPAAIAGTSMGAVIGAAYASGMTGADIRAYAVDLIRNRADFLRRLWKLFPRRMSEVSIGVGQYDLERILDAFMPASLPKDFAGLRIPLKMVATDYYAGKPVVFESGALLPAIAASAAVPMLFRPVAIDGRYLIDGSACNPVPFDLLVGAADVVVAVDVETGPEGDPGRRPKGIESLVGSASILMRSLLDEKLAAGRAPDILLRLPTGGFGALDFKRAAAIMASAESAKDEVKRTLERLCSPP